MNNNIKLYLVRFDYKDNSGDSFYKFGITGHYDVLNRFHDAQYNQWNIKVICSAYGPRNEVELLEKTLQKLYPKNFWLTEKLSGVTEIVKLNSTQVSDAVNLIKQYESVWYKNRKAQHD